MPSSVKTVPNPATYATAWRSAVQREAVIAPSGPRRDRDRGQLAEVRRHERQDARREERDEAREDRDQERVVAGHAAGAPSSTSASRRRSLAGLVASSTSRPPSATTGIVKAYRRWQVGVRLDVALDQARRRQPVRGAIGQQQLERRARLLAQVAAGARIQHEIGEGRGHGERIVGGRRRSTREAPGTSDRAAVDEGHRVRALTPVAVCRVRYSARLHGYGGSGGIGLRRRARVLGAALLAALLLASTTIAPAVGHGPESRPMLGKDAHADAGQTTATWQPPSRPASWTRPSCPASSIPRSSSSRRTAGSSSPRSAASSRSSTA